MSVGVTGCFFPFHPYVLSFLLCIILFVSMVLSMEIFGSLLLETVVVRLFANEYREAVPK